MERRGFSPLRQDLQAYHASISGELTAAQDRVRNLIGGRHWQVDGEHKEEVLRSILRLRLPGTTRVGKGFVCYPSRHDSSRQLDILITSASRPVLHREGELMFVTANAVEAIAEVKTQLRPGRWRVGSYLFPTLHTLADQVQAIRQSGAGRCRAGLFVYKQGKISHEMLLDSLKEAAQGNPDRVIDYVAIGDNLFAHYWENGRRQVNGYVNGPVWHSYEITKLAPAYFVSNMVVDVSRDISEEEQLAWFPIEGGKETRRRFYAALHDGGVSAF